MFLLDKTTTRNNIHLLLDEKLTNLLNIIKLFKLFDFYHWKYQIFIL